MKRQRVFTQQRGRVLRRRAVLQWGSAAAALVVTGAPARALGEQELPLEVWLTTTGSAPFGSTASRP